VPDTAPATGIRAARAAPSSSTVPHDWHSPHLPTHLAACHPHSVHRNTDLTALLVAMAGT
jgi:hypothetical protein